MTEVTEVVPGTQEAESVNDGQQQPRSEVTQEQPEKKPEAEAEQAEKKPDEYRGLIKRIGQLTAQKKALEARLQAQEPQAPQEQARQEPDIDTLVDKRADEKLRIKQFNEACDSVYKRGVEAHKEKFALAVTTLNATMGDESQMQQLLEAVIDPQSPDLSAEVIVHFADNPLDAAKFLDLNQRAQGREIAKLEAMFASKKAASASKAPAPVSTVSGAGRNSTSAVGTDDESEWYARREAELRKRR